MAPEERRRRNRIAVAKYRAANLAEVRRKTREAKAIWYAEHADEARGQARRRYVEHIKEARLRANKYGTEHAKERAQRAARWRDTNKERAVQLRIEGQKRRRERWAEFLESERERYQKNYQLDPGKYAAKGAKRRATTLRATPPWSDLVAITEIYRRARQLTLETGVSHDVDHVVPLRGKTVWGLHIPINLQILTSQENRRKFNKLDVRATDHHHPILPTRMAKEAN